MAYPLDQPQIWEDLPKTVTERSCSVALELLALGVAGAAPRGEDPMVQSFCASGNHEGVKCGVHASAAFIVSL